MSFFKVISNVAKGARDRLTALASPPTTVTCPECSTKNQVPDDAFDWACSDCECKNARANSKCSNCNARRPRRKTVKLHCTSCNTTMKIASSQAGVAIVHAAASTRHAIKTAAESARSRYRRISRVEAFNCDQCNALIKLPEGDAPPPQDEEVKGEEEEVIDEVVEKEGHGEGKKPRRRKRGKRKKIYCPYCKSVTTIPRSHVDNIFRRAYFLAHRDAPVEDEEKIRSTSSRSSSLESEYRGMVKMLIVDTRVTKESLSSLAQWRQENNFSDDMHRKVLAEVGLTEEDFEKLKDFEPGDMDDEALCVVCLDVEKNSVFVDCGHMATCYDCGKELKDCPLCRKPAKSVIRVYK